MELLRRHLLKYSIRTGEFVLKSGRRSSWFCDAKQTACRADGIVLVADAVLEAMPEDIDAIGGLAAGADPVAFGVAAIAAERGRPLRAFSIRKEAKDHGVQGRLAGALCSGDRVLIVEDTVTRGSSPLEAARVVRALGGEPRMILAVVDRGGTCAAAAAGAGLEFRALLTAPDLGFPYEPAGEP
ncbi:MAG: orotate phosphoribosyltransferase [bacterium]|nr:orotate phosphoribosyltransferase [bacterium]